MGFLKHLILKVQSMSIGKTEASSRRRDHSRRPLTPPYVRFRIRRFMLTLELLMTLQQ